MKNKKEPIYSKALNAMVDLINKMTPHVLSIEGIDKKVDQMSVELAVVQQQTKTDRRREIELFRRIKLVENRNNNLVDQNIDLHKEVSKLSNENKRLHAINFMYWHELKTYVPEHEWFEKDKETTAVDEDEESEPADKNKISNELKDLFDLNKDKKLN